MNAYPAGDVTLSIDHLVVQGLPPHEARRFAAALEAELHRLLEERGLPPALLAGLEGGMELDVPEDPGLGEVKAAGTRAAARSVAAALYRRLGR